MVRGLSGGLGIANEVTALMKDKPVVKNKAGSMRYIVFNFVKLEIC